MLHISISKPNWKSSRNRVYIKNSDTIFINIKLERKLKEEMPARPTFDENSSPAKIVRVSVDEMIAIMKRNSSNSFIPAALHNNSAGIPVLTQLM